MAVRKLTEIKTDTLFRTVESNAQKIGNKYFASIPVELLTWDDSYQRTDTRDMRKIGALARNWNPHKMSPLLVTAHREECKFCIVDGYGRYMANSLRMGGTTELECEIIFDTPEDTEERRKFEASLFVKQKDEEEFLKPYQKHKACLLLGDPVAMAIEESCQKHNVIIVSKTGQRKKGMLGSYTDAYGIARANGKDGLMFIFDTIEKLNWNEEANGYSRCVMRGLQKAYEKCVNEEVTQDKVIEMLRGTTPEKLRASAVAKYPQRNDQAATRMYIEDLLQ